MSLRPTNAALRAVTDTGASHAPLPEATGRLKAVLGCGVYKTEMKRGRGSDGGSDDVAPLGYIEIKLEWELVGKDGDAKTIPDNEVFTVPAAVLRLNPYEANVVHVENEYLMVHSRALERSHPNVNLGSNVYVFFSDDFLKMLREAIPGLPDPDTRLKDPSRNYGYPNGYLLQNA